MANVNINRSVTDTFYRYKMPRIIAKVEGKGNGIKTVIVNMPEVAKSLQRPPIYPTKYFGCELGAQTQYDPKNDRFIVNGSHDASKLQDLLDGFIKKFVLCAECDNPETNLNVQQKKGLILQRCIACGHQATIDMRSKIASFIIKNPQYQENQSGGITGTTPSKKDKRNKKNKKENGETSPEKTDEVDGGAPPAGGDQSPSGEHGGSEEDDECEWITDTSAEAVQRRMDDLTDAARSLAVNDDLEKSQATRLDIFYKFVKDKKERVCLSSGSDRELLVEAERLDVKDKAPLIMVELLLDENILVQIKQYRAHFLRFTHGNKKAQKYMLGGLEQLIGNVHHDALIPKVPRVFKMLYDLDILEEEVLIDWDKKISKKYVSKEVAKELHEKAAPIINWLKEAEEESSDEEEDGVEVEFTDREKTSAVKSAPKPAEVEDEDDLDIDNI